MSHRDNFIIVMHKVHLVLITAVDQVILEIQWKLEVLAIPAAAVAT